ncbi:hypothetical protein OIU78_025296, partial [Salix suchowensis]
MKLVCQNLVSSELYLMIF